MGWRARVLLSAGVVLASLAAGPRAAAAGSPPPGAAGPPGALAAPSASHAEATPDPRQLLQDQLEALDTAPLEGVLSEMNRAWAGYGPELSLEQVLDLYRGEGRRWDPVSILRGLAHYFLREVLGNSGLLLKLVVLSALAALLGHLQGAFAHEATSRIAHAVVYLALAGLALTGFGLAAEAARQVMSDLQGFLLALLPTLLVALGGLGGAATTALLQPALPVLTGGVIAITSTVVFPLIYLAAVLDIVSGLGEGLRLTHLASLLRQSALVVMGLALTVFLGVTGVKAVAGTVGDSLALRTAKYMSGALMPVVGKMFADAAELVWSSGLLLRNALGLLGLAGIFFITAFPCLKILSLILVYRGAAALVQPLGPTGVASLLHTMAGALTLMFVSASLVGLMFFLGVGVLLGAANAAAMLR
ncbi:stage III sporulation protein AE [Caldinitratiruptor microaerophilus]|uniref:stage III sporulation protein AE n=1 Tax=Caldinitratiruptor microaerophilus TaxID=671077 RepID=UPI00222F4947|nr:stage III sporulation protein AE [Caldinitratiruptor microaerophilus]